MSNKLFEQMAMLPAGLIALATAFTVTSCGSSEYKQYANDEAKQVASILRANDCLVCHAENAQMPNRKESITSRNIYLSNILKCIAYSPITA